MEARRDPSSLTAAARGGPVPPGPWAVRLPRGDAPAVAAALRLRADVRAAVDAHGGGGGGGGGDLWLRGDAMDDALDRVIRQLAPAARFAVSTAGSGEELIPHGNVLPVGRLSGALQWVPLHELFAVGRPAAAMPGQKPSAVRIAIVRSGTERPASMLRTSLATWAAYADTAPNVRLRALRFAATDGDVLIAGAPLPPLPGVRFWVEHDIAVPSGWTWSPAVDAATLRRALSLREHDVALFAADGSWQYVPAEAFVAARRSAVRRTAAGAAGAGAAAPSPGGGAAS